MLFRPQIVNRNYPRGAFVLNSNSPLAQGLVACWPLSGDIDIHRNLSILNQPALRFSGVGVSGRPRNGLVSKFDGSSNYLSPATTIGIPDFSLSKTVAIRIWVDPTISSPTKLIALSLVKDDTGGAGVSLDIEMASNSGFWTVGMNGWAGGSPTTTFNFPSDSTNGVCAQRWHDAIVTFDGTNYRLYIDGILGGTSAATISGSVGVVRIGSFNSAFPTPYFQGWLADALIANRCWSTEEIYSWTDPSTRNNLYMMPSTRIFFDIGAAVVSSKRPYRIPFIAASNHQDRNMFD